MKNEKKPRGFGMKSEEENLRGKKNLFQHFLFFKFSV
jgi:hypothetical protein